MFFSKLTNPDEGLRIRKISSYLALLLLHTYYITIVRVDSVFVKMEQYTYINCRIFPFFHPDDWLKMTHKQPQIHPPFSQVMNQWENTDKSRVETHTTSLKEYNEMFI